MTTCQIKEQIEFHLNYCLDVLRQYGQLVGVFGKFFKRVRVPLHRVQVASLLSNWESHYLNFYFHGPITKKTAYTLYKVFPSSTSLFSKVIMISGFPAAIAQVAGPSLAPFFRKHITTGTFRHPMARSSGLMPMLSTCSIWAPRSRSSCTSRTSP